MAALRMTDAMVAVEDVVDVIGDKATLNGLVQRDIRAGDDVVELA